MECLFLLHLLMPFSFPLYTSEAQKLRAILKHEVYLIKIKLYDQSDNKSLECKYSHFPNAA